MTERSKDIFTGVEDLAELAGVGLVLIRDPVWS
jgi:hypothetical protein